MGNEGVVGRADGLEGLREGEHVALRSRVGHEVREGKLVEGCLEVTHKVESRGEGVHVGFCLDHAVVDALDVDSRPVVLSGAVDEVGADVGGVGEVEKGLSALLVELEHAASDGVVGAAGGVEHVSVALVELPQGDGVVVVQAERVGVLGEQSQARDLASGGVEHAQVRREAAGQVGWLG